MFDFSFERSFLAAHSCCYDSSTQHTPHNTQQQLVLTVILSPSSIPPLFQSYSLVPSAVVFSSHPIRRKYLVCECVYSVLPSTRYCCYWIPNLRLLYGFFWYFSIYICCMEQLPIQKYWRWLNGSKWISMTTFVLLYALCLYGISIFTRESMFVCMRFCVFSERFSCFSDRFLYKHIMAFQLALLSVAFSFYFLLFLAVLFALFI